MYCILNRKRIGVLTAALFMCLIGLAGSGFLKNAVSAEERGGQKKDFIHWVDFNVPYEALDKALRLDVESHEQEEGVRLDWIDLLAYTAAGNGGDFKGFRTKQLEDVADLLKNGKTMEDLTKDMKYYSYYREAYGAVLSGLVGEYEIECADDTAPGGKAWKRKYGLKAFSPIAKNYPYSEFDDFGSSRSYGYRRKHLGHDLMGAVGTPVIAIEGGTVEALGWNQYGGWRIGIRSFDKKRYYYYAHLRKNFPYNKSLKEGSVVKPGDVIGYLGRTGYSANENVNNIEQSHLHFGIQLIFDESQKEGSNEIWIDCYALNRLLYRNRIETVKNPETKEYTRIYDIRDPSVPQTSQ